jgi:hypothetical protein
MGKCYKHQLLKKNGRIYLVRNGGNLRHYAARCVHCWWICQGCRLAMLTVFRRTVCRWWSFWNIKHTKVQLFDSASFYISLGYHTADLINNQCNVQGMMRKYCNPSDILRKVSFLMIRHFAIVPQGCNAGTLTMLGFIPHDVTTVILFYVINNQVQFSQFFLLHWGTIQPDAIATPYM